MPDDTSRVGEGSTEPWGGWPQSAPSDPHPQTQRVARTSGQYRSPVLSPLTCRTTSSLAAKSTSFTRRRNASSSVGPASYNTDATRRSVQLFDHSWSHFGMVFDLSMETMALRRYTDPIGSEWNVWDVPPKFHPKRSGLDRRALQATGHGPERRQAGDRRVTAPLKEWVHGWICFQNEGEKWRLCPLPAGWESASSDTLEKYRSHATRAVRSGS